MENKAPLMNKAIAEGKRVQWTRGASGTQMDTVDMKLDWVSNVSREALESAVIEYLFQLAGRQTRRACRCARVFHSSYGPSPIALDWDQLFLA